MWPEKNWPGENISKINIMSETRFADIGKVEAIVRLFEDTPFKPFERIDFEPLFKGGYTVVASSLLLEGIDFDLEYYPLKHLGYKSVLSVAGELYASLAHPVALSVRLGISAKLDYDQIRELWAGVVSASREQGFRKVSLDLQPSKNGLAIAMSAVGETAAITRKRCPAMHTKDLICVSGSLGAAFMGLQVLERGKTDYAKAKEEIGKYRMLVGSYLKPELSPEVVNSLEEEEIYPSGGYFVRQGLSDAIKRIVRDSGLGAKVYADKIPFEGNTFALGREMNIDPISAAMNGGEDFRLLFTIPILSLDKFRKNFQTFDVIGHLALPEVGAVLVTPDGLEIPLKAQGWPEEE